MITLSLKPAFKSTWCKIFQKVINQPNWIQEKKKRCNQPLLSEYDPIVELLVVLNQHVMISGLSHLPREYLSSYHQPVYKIESIRISCSVLTDSRLSTVDSFHKPVSSIHPNDSKIRNYIWIEDETK